MFDKLELVAPSYWASHFVNGDSSGLDSDDVVQVNAFRKRQGVMSASCVSCEDAGFRKMHDAWQEYPWQADCQTYLFLIERKA
jgi:hypothetical protein